MSLIAENVSHPSVLEVKAGGSGVQGHHPQSPSKSYLFFIYLFDINLLTINS